MCIGCGTEDKPLEEISVSNDGRYSLNTEMSKGSISSGIFLCHDCKSEVSLLKSAYGWKRASRMIVIMLACILSYFLHITLFSIGAEVDYCFYVLTEIRILISIILMSFFLLVLAWKLHRNPLLPYINFIETPRGTVYMFQNRTAREKFQELNAGAECNIKRERYEEYYGK